VPSSPLVPRNDPTLMFTNAGMVQFKNVFTGVEKRPYPARHDLAEMRARRRQAQRPRQCRLHRAPPHLLRDARQLLVRRLLQGRAIELAWNLITKEFGLPKDKLLVTVYHDDDEALRPLEEDRGLPDDRIIRIPTSDNFWAMGDTGPCGPCSEIFYDHGDKIWGGPPGSPTRTATASSRSGTSCSCSSSSEPGQRVALPKPSIDTGMGLERIAACCRASTTTTTSTCSALIARIVDATGVEPEGAQPQPPRHRRSSARVVFLIADGVLPSNEGRGYVLRRIMRRAMRHAHMLGAASR
jgi:alanyl-tRNA synthetase